MLSVTRKSVGREEPLMLSRQEVWRPLPANSATTAMPRKCCGHLQVATEIHLALNLSVTSHQRVTALIKLPTPKVNWLCAENIPCYNQRLWKQEIYCQNVTVQLMA